MGRYLNNGAGAKKLIELIKTADKKNEKATADITKLIGANSGIATLDKDGHIPASQLPGSVDEIIEAASLTNFPTTGESGKIYVALDTNLTYRWGGTKYTEISPSIALGETDATAYPGSKGAANAKAISAEVSRAKAAEEANAKAIANVATTAEIQALFSA